jgi:hypothetical protein
LGLSKKFKRSFKVYSLYSLLNLGFVGQNI